MSWSPYSLFLILVLLSLANNPRLVQKLNFLDQALQATRTSLNQFKEGLEIFHARAIPVLPGAPEYEVPKPPRTLPMPER
jgi:hypothetical protein